MESRKDFELCSPFVNVGQGSHLERVILSGICQHHGTMMCTRHGSYITHYITYTAIPLAGQFATQLAKKRVGNRGRSRHTDTHPGHQQCLSTLC